MAENFKIFPLRAQSGIKLDGTSSEGGFWNSGLWTRFYRGLPRSILGYRSMTETFTGTSRGIFVNPNGAGFLNLFNGTANKLEVGQFTYNGFGNNPTDITPSGFAANANNLWQLDTFFNQNGGNKVDIIAHAAQNLSAIDSSIAAPVYYGDVNAVAPLLPAYNDAGTPAIFTIDGGIVSMQPYLIAYGTGGLVAWSAVGNPSLFPLANAANVCATKIVKGIPIRGGSSSPSCLLWSLDSVIQMSFVGGTAIWNFNTISDQSSIMSSSCVVEMDGIYYWAGIDRFLVYNGALRPLPNQLNSDFFFTTMNYAQRQKAFGFKVPRWNEIWWCFPSGTATECNHAVIYNTVEQTWYDTALPSDGRSAAYFAQTFSSPILTSANGLTPIGQNSGTNYPIWQHEFGNDSIRGNQIDAIQSYVVSPPISVVGGGLSYFGGAAATQDDVWTQLVRFEPDFNMGTALNISILTRTFASDTDTVVDTRVITPTTQQFDIQKQGRYIRWKIESNTQGGFFQMGTPYISYRMGDRNKV